MTRSLGLGRLCDGTGSQNRCISSTNGTTRAPRRTIGGEQYLGDGSTGVEATVRLFYGRAAGPNRETDRCRKHSGHQLFQLHCLVAVENDLLTKTSSFREEGARRLGLDPRRTLFEKSSPLRNHTFASPTTNNAGKETELTRSPSHQKSMIGLRSRLYRLCYESPNNGRILHNFRGEIDLTLVIDPNHVQPGCMRTPHADNPFTQGQPSLAVTYQ